MHGSVKVGFRLPVFADGLFFSNLWCVALSPPRPLWTVGREARRIFPCCGLVVLGGCGLYHEKRFMGWGSAKVVLVVW